MQSNSTNPHPYNSASLLAFLDPEAYMLKQFYKKALPRQGIYCVTGIDQVSRKTSNRFAETLDDLFNEIEKCKAKKLNTYVALGSFDGYSRKAENNIYFRSLFIDLDVGEGKFETKKGYETKQDASDALDKFMDESGLPPPIRIDSGTGIHAYWLFDEDIPSNEYIPYAEKFKDFCLKLIHADPAVMADRSRIMRCPETFNYKTDPPSPSIFIDTEFSEYSFEEFKEFLGKIETVDQPTFDVFAGVRKGLDEDTRAISKMDNFENVFETIADKSMDGNGCEQIKYAIEHRDNLPEPVWRSALSIIKFCSDGERWSHELFNEDPRYSKAGTEEKLSTISGTLSCEEIEKLNPGVCAGCKHFKKLKNPLSLGRALKIATPTNKTDSPRQDKDSEEIPNFPDYLRPFVRGEKGGIYYLPEPKIDKDGVEHYQAPKLISPYDFFPIRRMYSALDGECLLMKLLLPNDKPREFLLPLKVVYATDRFKECLASNGVLYTPTVEHIGYLQTYIVKWGNYLINRDEADIMRMQMGWTEDKKGFVIGGKEILETGKEVESAASPYVRGIAKYIAPVGSYTKWQDAVNQLNQPGFEMHAFGLLVGFGSPLMRYTSTAGVTVCFLGKSGCAKTGAMYAGLSVFGHPKELSIFEATDNGMTGRYLGLHNIMLGVDEIGNKDAKILSQLTHKISHGKAKIRMQASVNAEREHELSASLIGMFTTNESAYSKFESIKASPDGESARLVEFLIKKPEALKAAGGGQLGRQMFDTLNYNYGHAGPAYIKEVFRLGDNYIKDTMEIWREKFLHDFGDDSTYRFYENLVLSCFTGGTIANNSSIITLDCERVYDKVVGDMIDIRDKVITLNKSDYPAILTDYINKYLANVLVIKEGKVVMEPRGGIVARIDTDKSLLQVSKTTFKQYLHEKNISYREFEHDMTERGILDPTHKKGRLTSGWKNAVSVDPTYLYWFKTEIPAEWLLDEADSDN